MPWIKKQWKKIIAVVTVLTASGIVIFNNGEKVTVTPYQGVHLLAPDFGVVYANGGKQIGLKAGERFISIGLVLDASGVVQYAGADTLDATVDMGIVQKFTQCKR